MQPTIISKYFGAGKSAITSPLNTEPLNADMETFRPIDFLPGGYGTCMMGIMDKIAGQNGFNLSEARTEIGFEMLPDNNRIDIINIKCFIPKENYPALFMSMKTGYLFLVLDFFPGSLLRRSPNTVQKIKYVIVKL